MELARLFPGVLLAPTANHVISAGEHEIAKTHARDRAGYSNAGLINAGRTPGNSGECGQRDEDASEECP
jgi:hypothetical protein